MNQLKIKIGSSDFPVFFHKGFYAGNDISNVVHNHIYSEIHTVLLGEVQLFIEDKAYIFKENEAFIIPKYKNHYYISKSENAFSTSFQINKDIKRVEKIEVDSRISELLKQELDKMPNNVNYSNLAAYLSIIASAFWDERLSVESATEHSFIIHNFFALNYNRDAKLEELAQSLHFSEKQTERMVKKITNMSFKQNLLKNRMKIADFLKEYTELTDLEISKYVGYESYSGYYKARKAMLKDCDE